LHSGACRNDHQAARLSFPSAAPISRLNATFELTYDVSFPGGRINRPAG